MFGTESCAAALQRLFMDLEGVLIPAERLQVQSQVIHGRECGWVVGAELDPRRRQRLFIELEGIGVPAEGLITAPQVINSRKRGWMIRLQVLGGKRAGSFDMFRRDLGFAEVQERSTQGQAQPHFNKWLIGEALVHK